MKKPGTDVEKYKTRLIVQIHKDKEKEPITHISKQLDTKIQKYLYQGH